MAFFEAWTHLRSIQEPTTLVAWMLQFAQRAVRRFERDEERRCVAEDAFAAEAGAFDSDEDREVAAVREQRILLVMTLPRPERILLRMRFVEGRTLDEVAARLGCSERSVFQKTLRARNRLMQRDLHRRQG